MRHFIRIAVVLGILGILGFPGCGGGGGGLKKKLSGKDLISGAKGLKPADKDSVVGGKTSSNESAQVQGGGQTKDNIQSGDGGDPVWKDVPADLNGDGKENETVTVTLDDETGDYYVTGTYPTDVDGDGTQETVDLLVQIHPDGSGELHIDIQGYASVECSVSASGTGTCTIKDAKTGEVQNVSFEDLTGGNSSDSSSTGSGDCGKACDYIYGCGLFIKDESGQPLSKAECVSGCSSDPEAKTIIPCILKDKSCSESAIEACIYGTSGG